MGWRLAALLMFMLAGCRCLEPVSEALDGGTGGGSAGGAGGGGGGGGGSAGGIGGGAGGGGTAGGSGGGSASDGGGAECTTAAQCTGGPAPQSPPCPSGFDAGNSCIDQRCVYECTNGRACDYDAGTSCLICSTPQTIACETFGCGAATMQGSVEAMSTTCQIPFTDAMLVPTGGCQYHVIVNGVTLGTITQTSGGTYVGQFDGLGTCVGVSLFTQIERWHFSCSGCQFVLRI